MVRHLGWHRPRNEGSRHSVRYRGRSDETSHDGALREAAEHDPGVGAIGRRGLNVVGRVPDPRDDGQGEIHAGCEIAAGWVVDRIHVYRLAARLRPQRVDERLSDPADSW